MRIVVVIGLTLTALSGLTANAEPMIGSPAGGLAFAQEVCSACHIVAHSQTTVIAQQAPSFESIARAAKTTELSLRVFLQSPHINMPNFILSEQETDDVVAYILSLRELSSD